MNILKAIETACFKGANCIVWERRSIKLLEYEGHRAGTRDSWETQVRLTACEGQRRRTEPLGAGDTEQRGADLDPKNQLQRETETLRCKLWAGQSGV